MQHFTGCLPVRPAVDLGCAVIPRHDSPLAVHGDDCIVRKVNQAREPLERFLRSGACQQRFPQAPDQQGDRHGRHHEQSQCPNYCRVRQQWRKEPVSNQSAEAARRQSGPAPSEIRCNRYGKGKRQVWCVNVHVRPKPEPQTRGSGDGGDRHAVSPNYAVFSIRRACPSGASADFDGHISPRVQPPCQSCTGLPGRRRPRRNRK